MRPEIDILGISIKTFGVCFAAAFLVAGAVLARRLRELGRSTDWAYEIVFAALVGGLLGARGYYLLQHSDQLGQAPLRALFGGSGLVWYGGLVGGAIGVLGWAYRRGWRDLGVLDAVSVPLALGYAIGRIGCQLSGDGDYGKPSQLPWAMAYPHGTVPTTVRVQPTPIYETLAMGAVAWLLWRARDRLRPGALFAAYLVAAGVERFVVEFWRRNSHALLGLTGPQLESIALIVAGTVGLLALRRHGGAVARRPGPA